MSFINATPYGKTPVTNESRITDNFDEDIDEFEYDLNPFETHDNFKTFRPDLTMKHGIINATPKTPFLSSIEDFDLDDDDDDDIGSNESNSDEDDILKEDLEFKQEFETHFTVRKTTILPTTGFVASTVGRSEIPTTTTAFVSTSTTEKTTPQIIETTEMPYSTMNQEDTSPMNSHRFNSIPLSSTEPYEWSTNLETFILTSTEEPTSILTFKPTSTRTTTVPSTTSSTTSAPQTHEPKTSTSSKMNKNNHKIRKHNHKKHQRQHLSSQETKSPDSSNENREFRAEDFDNLDPEIEMKLSEKSNTSNNNGRKKHKVSNGKQPALERNKMKSTQSTELESSEKTSTTMKTKQERGKHRNSDVIVVKKKTTNVLSRSKDSTTSDPYFGFNNSKIKKKRSSDYDEHENSDEKEEWNLPDQASPSVDEDQFILRDENGTIITSSPLMLQLTNGNMSNFNELKGINKLLISLIGKDEKFDPKQAFSKSPTLEYINLALALLVWSTRYPSVFWESSKAFTLIFSFQLIANSIDILVLYAGTEILFKVQTVGEFMTINNQPSPLLLNGIVTLALTLLAFLLIISSSMILYLYGHSRLAAKIRDCKTITLKETDVWSYFSHCASLCFVLALAVVKAPIIHDLSVSYRMSFEKKLLYASK